LQSDVARDCIEDLLPIVGFRRGKKVLTSVRDDRILKRRLKKAESAAAEDAKEDEKKKKKK
jgi:hypothetical protein